MFINYCINYQFRSTSFFSKGTKRQRDRHTLLKTWFVLALPTITIAMDQAICVLLHKAKENSWSLRLKNHHSNQDRDDILPDPVKKRTQIHTHCHNWLWIYIYTKSLSICVITLGISHCFPLSNIVLHWTKIICKYIPLDVLSNIHILEIKQYVFPFTRFWLLMENYFHVFVADTHLSDLTQARLLRILFWLLKQITLVSTLFA
jgi:hypothetical protein